MIRKAFKMKLYPDALNEYTKRHNPIWENLEITLKEHGVRTYSIFFDPDTHLLFGYAEVESEKQWENIATTPVCREWWDHMAVLMETNPDNSPVSAPLSEVFHLT